MTRSQYRLFITIIVAISLGVAVAYFRYSYMTPHSRYDIWQGEYQVMVPGGDWVEETLAQRET